MNREKQNSIFILVKDCLSFISFYLIKIILDITYKDITSSESKKILIINTEKLGDIILSLDFLNSLEKTDKYDELYIVVDNKYQNLLDNCHLNLVVIPLDKIKYKFNLLYRIKFLSRLVNSNFNISLNISPERGFINEEITLLSTKEKRVAIKDNSPYLHPMFTKITNKKYSEVFNFKIKNEYFRLKEVVKRMNLTFIESENLFEVNNNYVKDSKINPFITVAPMSSVKYRNWSLEHFMELCSVLSKRNFILLLGTNEQSPELQKIADLSDNIINYAGSSTLSELPIILSECKLFIGLDSGLTHMALHLRIPLIGIVGGGMYGIFFPYKQSSSTIFLKQNCEYSPCFWNCKYSRTFCVKDVSVDVVLSKAYKLIENT